MDTPLTDICCHPFLSAVVYELWVDEHLSCGWKGTGKSFDLSKIGCVVTFDWFLALYIFRSMFSCYFGTFEVCRTSGSFTLNWSYFLVLNNKAEMPLQVYEVILWDVVTPGLCLNTLSCLLLCCVIRWAAKLYMLRIKLGPQYGELYKFMYFSRIFYHHGWVSAKY